MLALVAVHFWLPAGKRRFVDIVPGIIFTLIGWLVGSTIFAAYLDHFSSYVTTYAGLASIMIAVVFLYIVSLIFILGGELNAAISRYLEAAPGWARPTRCPPEPSRAPVADGQRHAQGGRSPCRRSEPRAVLAEQRPGHDRGNRRDQIEQRRDLGYLAVRIISISRKIAPIDSTSTSQASAKTSSPFTVTAPRFGGQRRPAP